MAARKSNQHPLREAAKKNPERLKKRLRDDLAGIAHRDSLRKTVVAARDSAPPKRSGSLADAVNGIKKAFIPSASAQKPKKRKP